MTLITTLLGKLKTFLKKDNFLTFLTLQDRVFTRPHRSPGASAQPRIQPDGNLVDLLHLLGVRGHSASTVYGAENW